MNLRYIFFLMTLIVCACEPSIDEKIDLGDPPFAATFEITAGAEPNTYILTNTTAGTFLHEWDLGDGNKASGESITAFYPRMGSYTVTLTAFNQAGFATATDIILVDEDVKPDCTSSPFFEFLTNCDSKSWGLFEGEGALWVGPPDESQTFWQNPEEEVNTRSCAWDDRWVFSEDGTMSYVTNGDIWAEDYMGFGFECIDETLLQPSQSTWGAGEHEFVILPNGDDNDLQVTGLGSFIGLPKVTNGAETNMPQESTTYSVFDFYNDGSKDLIVLKIDAGGVLWRFTLEAK